jgi:alkaline phosphatase
MKRQLLRLAAATVAAAVAITTLLACGGESRHAKAPRAKNVILMVGDGMGLAQVTALMIARDYAPVQMERAAVGGFVKTYSANNRVTDSAASATTYAAGEKTDNGHLSVAPDGSPLPTILEKAERAGLRTGLVATTHLMHATPAAFYAHNPDRGKYEDIALEFASSGVDVAIGGGRRYMSERNDGRNLIEELEAQGYTVADSLDVLDVAATTPAAVIYPGGGLPLATEGRDPAYLAKATARSLELLSGGTGKGSGGFFLMVEGSYIDSAGHGNDAELLLGEMRDFDAAVGVAFDWADAHPGTLVIVLADHETGGLSIPSGKSDFLLPDSGVEFRWSTGGHSGTMIPLFAYGAQASLFGGIMDNTEVNHRMEQLLGLE